MSDGCFLRAVSRPAISEVHAALQTWGGVVAHFSGVPPGVPARLHLKFPADLRHVLDGHAQSGIGCSTVRPGDIFEDSGSRRRNSWGCIAVLVRARTPWSLVCVDAHDCGSFVDSKGIGTLLSSVVPSSLTKRTVPSSSI
jgi:hypothetical protein